MGFLSLTVQRHTCHPSIRHDNKNNKNVKQCTSQGHSRPQTENILYLITRYLFMVQFYHIVLLLLHEKPKYNRLIELLFFLYLFNPFKYKKVTYKTDQQYEIYNFVI